MCNVGYVVGGWWNDKGSLINYFCLFLDLILSGKLVFSGCNYLFGVEYEIIFWGIYLFNEDVFCVVCLVVLEIMFFMVFGRDFCYFGWIK